MKKTGLTLVTGIMLLAAALLLANRTEAAPSEASIVVGVAGGEWRATDRIEIALRAGDDSGHYRFRGFDAAILEGDSEAGPFRAGKTKRVLTDDAAMSLALGDPSGYDPAKTYKIAYRVLYSPVGLDAGILVPGSPDNGKDGWIVAQDGSGRDILIRSRIVDRTPPNVAVEMTDEAGDVYESDTWTSRSVTASVYATDDSGEIASLDYRIVFGDGTVVSEWQPYASAIAFADEGVYALSVRATDPAGNETMQSRIVKIDRQGISLSVAMKSASGGDYPDGSWSNVPVALTAGARSPKPDVRIDRVAYSLDGGASWEDVPGEGIVLRDEGMHAVAFRATDELGGAREENRTVKIDVTPPLLAIEGVPDGWTNGEVTATITASDALSGIARLEYSLEGAHWVAAPDAASALVTVDEEGERTLFARATDLAGNAATEQAAVRIGKDGITLLASWVKEDGTPYAEGSWSDQAVILKASASHAQAGVGIAAIAYSLDDGAHWSDAQGSPAIRDDGAYDVIVRATDTLGNERSATTRVKIDTTAPRWPAGASLTVESKGSDYAVLSWSGSPASDNMALSLYRVYEGDRLVAELPATATRTAATGLRPDATYSFAVQAVDEAGNASMDGPRVSARTEPATTRPVDPVDPGTPKPPEPGGRDHPKDPDSPVKPPLGAEDGEGTGPLPEFRDIDRHWAGDRIREAASKRIAGGYPDGTFRPDRPITRAEFVAMLTKALDLKESSEDRAFADEAGIRDWAKDAIHRAARAGILFGDANGNVRPEARLTRAEMAVLVYRALSFAQGESPAAARIPVAYADAGSIPDWARPAIGKLSEEGLIRGRAGNLVAPNESATRAEAVVTLLNALERIAAQKAIAVE